MSLEYSALMTKVKDNPDLSFYILYTFLYVFIIGLTNVVNGVVGNNYGWYDVHFYWENTNFIFEGLWPYRDFNTAYPPFSLAVYLIPYLLAPDEGAFYYTFTIFTYIFSLLAIHGLLKFCDAKGLDHKYVYITFLLLIIGVNNFFIARNDTITTVFVVLCILLYWKQKYAPAFICLALGIMTKIYPIFLLPVLLIPFLVKKDWNSLFKYGLITVGVCFIIELPFIINDPSTAFSYLSQHSGRGLEIESIVAIPLMVVSMIDPSLVYVGMDESWDLFGPWAEAVAPFIMPFTLAVILAFMIYFLVRMWKTDADLEKRLCLTLMACSVVLMLFMSFNKVFCAQYVMWIIMLYPLLIYSFKTFGINYRRLLYHLVALAAATLLTVAFMGSATDGITIQYLLADILKGIAALSLLYYLFKALRTALDSCSE